MNDTVDVGRIIPLLIRIQFMERLDPFFILIPVHVRHDYPVVNNHEDEEPGEEADDADDHSRLNVPWPGPLGELNL